MAVGIYSARTLLSAGAIVAVALLVIVSPPALAQPSFITFESGQVRPLATSPDGSRLFAVNTPDNQLEIFDIDGSGNLTRAGVVQVGMEPVAVAARSNTEVWVVNHLSDSVSVIDLGGAAPRVVRTLLVGDEPNDIVFAGPGGNRAFITTAHRGQNSPYPDGEYDTKGIGRADVWVFNAADLGGSLGGDEMTIVTLFGDKPRALAVSSDGATVYAAIFHSGNQTTVMSEGHVCDTSGSNMNNDNVQGSCSINGVTSPGGYPPPHQNHQDIDRPETGLIVKFNRDGGVSDQWQDELGRNWNAMVAFELPDRDVFAINANAATPAAVDGSATCANGSGCWAGVGTVIFNMAVNPVSGKIYVSNTDSQNHVRFEGPGSYASSKKPGGEPDTVQGNLAQARITVLDGSSVIPRHLNKHIDYSILPAPAGTMDDSLATPLQMAVSGDGSTLYVSAFGSEKIGIFSTSALENDTFTPDSNDHIQLSGGGPSGVLISGNRLYVLTRFDNSVAVIDPVTRTEVQKLALHNPEPADVVAGRPFLYSATLTSSNGEASCSSCHIFADMDDLGWDLGNPDDNQKNNNNPFNPIVPGNGFPLAKVFHPSKGPMVTQSLRGLVSMGPQHWRGDREGDAEFSFNAFNVAIPGLVGRSSQLSTQDMQAFTDFALQLVYPPNPTRKLENVLRTNEAQGAALYFQDPTDQVTSCNGCHTLDAPSGFFGGDGATVFDGTNQHLKTPHLRNMYQKIGMFGMRQIEPSAALAGIGQGAVALLQGPFTDQGAQIRGFGYTHEGSIDSLFRFFGVGGFTLNDSQQAQVEAYMIAFDTDLPPAVGQQVTLTSTNSGVAVPRISLLIDRAEADFTSAILGGTAQECNLIAKLVEDGVQRGYLYDKDTNLFHPDDGGGGLTDATLRTKAGTAGQEITYTCTPAGSGNRMGLDRDQDTLLDGVETNTGVFVSAADTGTDPALEDTDADGFNDDVEVAGGYDPTNPLDYPGAPPLAVCGNGVLETGEDCDDSNTADGDCCSSTCQFETLGSSCDDGDACTDADTCDGAGSCQSGGALSCDDANLCTDDSCDSGSGCINANNVLACDDGDACTTADTCTGGACLGGAPPVCDDANLCTDDSCDSGSGCINANNVLACDDGDTCTTADTCAGGACAGGAPLDCDDGDSCTADSCDSITGCGHEPILVGACAPPPVVPSFTGAGHALLIFFVLMAGGIDLVHRRITG